MDQLTDNSLRVLNSLDEMEQFRVTGVAAFQQCPARWKAEQLGAGMDGPGSGGSSSKYAEMGTAAHTVIERFLDAPRWLGWFVEQETLISAGMPKAEREKVEDYLNGVMATLRPITVVTEQKLKGSPAGPENLGVTGTLDLICLNPKDGYWEIWDHKTNRQYEDAEDWKVKLQPRFYHWLLRKFLIEDGHLPHEIKIRYNIGYVLLNCVVTWECDPTDAEAVEALFKNTLEEFKVYRRTREWPERINDWCYNCPLVKRCKTAQEALNDLEALAEQEQEVRTPLEYYDFLANVKKLAEGLLDVERSAIQFVMTEQGKEEWKEAGFKATLKKASRRKAEFAAVYAALDFSGDLNELNDVFTVKVGGLDRYVKANPEIELPLVGVVTAEEAEEPTLTIRRIK